MSLIKKINFQILKLSRMTWFAIRFTVHKWKKLEGILIPVNLQYGYSVLRFINNGEYEQGEISIIRNTLQPGDTVLELGTGIGFISAYCAKKIGSENVFTFEANPFLGDNIHQLYKKNTVNPSVTFALLGESTGTKIFYRDTESFLASSIIENKKVKQEIIQIPVMSLNEMISQIRPTYLVMDIEGGEYDIFGIIDFQTIQKVQFELHPEALGNEKVAGIFKRLKDNHFAEDKSFSSGNNFYFQKN